MQQAQDTGQSVVVSADTTSDTLVFANPDGTFTANLASGPVREPDPSNPGAWNPIDTTLQQTSAGFEPAVSDTAITFSDGGTGLLASIVDGADRYTLDWIGSLPVPSVSGDTATYANVFPGVDLTLQARPSGFEQSFIVRSPPTSPLVLRIPLALRGLHASVGGDGQIVLTNASGAIVGGADPAMMWGAAIDPNTQEPVIQQQLQVAIVNDGGSMLEVTPDPSFFSNPDLTYPVTIDPAPDLSVNKDTFVRSGNPDVSYFTDTELKSGLSSGSDVARSFIKFGGTSVFDGTHVLSATLKLYETASNSCTASEVDVYGIAAAFSQTTTWNNQPAADTLYAAASVAKGYSSSCASDWVTISTGGASGHTLADLAQTWADGAPVNGLEVRAADESSATGWKKFKSSEAASNGPILSVTYNTLPDVPTSLSVTDGSTLQPTLHAVFSDPDGGSGYVEYSIYDADSNLVQTTNGGTVTTGTDSSYYVPSGLLQAGIDYVWTARGYDGTDYSPSTRSLTVGAVNDPCQPVQIFSQPPTGFDPTTASDADLATYGFPPRPPASDSPAVADWTTAMTNATTYEAPNPTCTSLIHPAYNSIWAGHVVPSSAHGGQNYTNSTSSWTQPSVPSDSIYSDWRNAPGASFWVGTGVVNLIQAGADSFAIGTPVYKFWTEDYPGASHYEGPVVHSGDAMYVFEKYQGSHQAYYFLENQSSGHYSAFVNAAPYVGLGAANFVNERLYYHYLPNFGDVTVFSNYYGNASNNYTLSSNNTTYIMTSNCLPSGTVLSSPGSVGGAGGFGQHWHASTPYSNTC